MSMSSTLRREALLSLGLVLLTGCSTPYYKTMELFGYEKRDILTSRVEDGRDEQQEAKEQFVSALEAFKSVANFDGGDLDDSPSLLTRWEIGTGGTDLTWSATTLSDIPLDLPEIDDRRTQDVTGRHESDGAGIA